MKRVSPSLRGAAASPAVKICGLTRLQDVIAARDLGVWALGFVFAPSARQLEPAAARELLDKAGLGGDRASCPAADRTADGGGSPITVGVFTDADVGEIVGVVEQVGLDAVQLHGHGGPMGGEVADALGGDERTKLVIQALPVDSEESDATRLRESVAGVGAKADVVLLDTGTRDKFGGSGKSFNWGLAREVTGGAEGVPVLVAGGIDPDNVVAALSESGAWGVDVSSGVESSPGVKDAESMRRLVDRVKEGTEK